MQSRGNDFCKGQAFVLISRGHPDSAEIYAARTFAGKTAGR
ncbi:hypothetical protein ASZ90_010901 [hydrocarbon metagenome]|uniref:Uncharacterized protein n=1 Tax=hydrocarbon metagenome TaxID=938273 RepID=A0A0W8FEP2_9ZZZZ